MFSAAKLPKKAKSRLSAANFFPRDQRRPGRQRCGAGRQWLWRGRLRRPGFGGPVSETRFQRPGFGTDRLRRRSGAPATIRGPGDDAGSRRRCGVPAAMWGPGGTGFAGLAARPIFRSPLRAKRKHPGNLPGCLCPCCRRLFRAAGAECSVAPYLAARMLFSA